MDNEENKALLETAKKIKEEQSFSDVKYEPILLIENQKLTQNLNLNLKKKIKQKINNFKYKKEININSCKYPYFLSRNRTLIELDEMYGCEIIVKGKYCPVVDNIVDDKYEPLTLEITADSNSGLENVCSKISEIMDKGRDALSMNSGDVRTIYMGNKEMCMVKLILGLYEINENYKIKEKIEEEYKIIEKECRVKILFRGKFSGYIEKCLGDESNDPCYLQIIAEDILLLEEAKKKCINLIIKVKNEISY